jgi:hypothetical protein
MKGVHYLNYLVYSEEDVKKKLFYMLLMGDAREWYHSLLHTDRDNSDI